MREGKGRREEGEREREREQREGVEEGAPGFVALELQKSLATPQA